MPASLSAIFGLIGICTQLIIDLKPIRQEECSGMGDRAAAAAAVAVRW